MSAGDRIAGEQGAGGQGVAALVLRAREGDRAAFGELYADHAPMVNAVLLGLVAVREAQDLVHDVFLTALRRLEQLEEPRRFGPWVAAIARNRARDLLRSRGRAITRLSDVEEPADMRPGGDPADPTARAADAEQAERALAALRTLPEAYRETLALRLVEGLAGREIAQRMGMTHGSVRVNLCRGMKLLRERLAEVGVDMPREMRGGGAVG